MVILLIIVTLVIISVITLIIGRNEKNTNGLCDSEKRLEGKVAIVTGGTAGIGLEIATDFAKRGAEVIIACPFEEEGKNARKQINEITGNNKVIFKVLDLTSLSSIRNFAEEILKQESRLDILVNNAGLFSKDNATSYNGTNITMHVNYFGHFLLTILLLPLLRKTGKENIPSRIIFTGSIMHLLGTVDFSCYEKQNDFNQWRTYCNSKFCCVLISHELAKRLKGSNVVVNSVDPGIVGTNIYKTLFMGYLYTFFTYNIFKTPKQGAQTAIHVAVDDDAGRVSGQFFRNCKLSRAKSSAYDDELARKLFDDSVKLAKLDEQELERCLSSGNKSL